MVWGGADFGTDIGQCNFICPVVATEESVFENYYIAKGSYPGKDQASLMQGPMECPARHFQTKKTTYWNIFQGVTILIDLESFDAGPSKTATTGSTISHFYWKYIPVLSQSGISVQPGTSTELGLTTQVVETTEVAKRRFTPEERGCFFEDEIRMVKGFKIWPTSSQKILGECKHSPFLSKMISSGEL